LACACGWHSTDAKWLPWAARAHLKWSGRKKVLLDSITAMNADVLCLQVTFSFSLFDHFISIVLEYGVLGSGSC
jgi:hypothetical protein